MTGNAEELLIGLELRRLAERYALAVDNADGDLFAAQFTAEGVLEAPRGRFAGHDALRTVPSMTRQRYEKTFHAVLNLVPTISGDRAEAETYAIARHFYRDGESRALCYEMTIRYQDRFEWTVDGWRFAKRRLVVDGTQTFAVDEPRR